MHPIIHRKEEALLEQLEPELAKKLEELQGLEREGEHDRTRTCGTSHSPCEVRGSDLASSFTALPSTSSSFDSYALHLLSTLPPPVTPTLPPLPESSSSPTTPTAPSKKTHKHTRSQALSPLSHSVLLPEVVVQGPESAGLKSGRRSSLAARLVSGSRSPALGGGGWGGALGIDEDGEGSEEILEGLLRGSQKGQSHPGPDVYPSLLTDILLSSLRLDFQPHTTLKRTLKQSPSSPSPKPPTVSAKPSSAPSPSTPPPPPDASSKFQLSSKLTRSSPPHSPSPPPRKRASR